MNNSKGVMEHAGVQVESSIQRAAIEYIGAGLSVIPIVADTKKSSVAWAKYQKEIMPLEDVNKLFSGGNNIALVCGAVSGNLECLDFDNPELFQPFIDTLESINPELLFHLVRCKTPSGGYHLIYRCYQPIEGNKKLAMSADGKTWIETRGQGGYFLTFPSPGYHLLENKLTDVPVLKVEEREILLNLAQSFSKKIEPREAITRLPRDLGRPGDEYNKKADHSVFIELLDSAGWTRSGKIADGWEHWTRPGKSEGTSATFKDNNLFVFSTNAGLPTGPHNAFSVFAHLKHDGDFSEAAKNLKKQGNGKLSVSDCTGETGGGDLLVKNLEGGYVFDKAEGVWYKFNNHFWIEDHKNQILREVNLIEEEYNGRIKQLYSEKSKINGEGDNEGAINDKIKRFQKELTSLRTITKRKNIIEYSATGDNSLAITGNEWDQNPFLLGCPNGVINLRTGELRAGKPEDYIKACVPTEYLGKDEPCPVWEKTVSEIFGDDQELLSYVHKLFGYGITGSIEEAIFPIFWGQGSNGKTTILEIFHSILGNKISGPIQSEMLLVKTFNPSSSGPNPDVMSLRGKRLCWASESNDGRGIDSSQLKKLTGGDTLSGRYPYGKKFIEFQPSHKLLLLTNHKPKVASESEDPALWRRIALIPFTNTFVVNPSKPNEKPIDKHLRQKLEREKSGILAWFVRGCLLWQKEGLEKPDCVIQANSEYSDENDLLASFVNDCCNIDKSSKTKAIVLYNEYKRWCEDNGHHPMSNTKFGRKMGMRFEKSLSSGSNYYNRLSIKKINIQTRSLLDKVA
jgi:putative DNA primase/helicase